MIIDFGLPKNCMILSSVNNPQYNTEMIQIKIRELIIFIIIIALFSSLLINCSQHSLIKALEHSIEQRDSLLNESFKLKY